MQVNLPKCNYFEVAVPSVQQIASPSVYPMIQTALFTLGTVALIHLQRFVVLPLLLAGSYYHMDLLRQFPTVDYAVGKAQSDVNNWCKFVKKQYLGQSCSDLRNCPKNS